jgi:hypothetical protein
MMRPTFIGGGLYSQYEKVADFLLVRSLQSVSPLKKYEGADTFY